MLELETVNKVIASGEYNDLLGIVKGFRNGAVYGNSKVTRRQNQISSCFGHDDPV